MAPVTGLPSLFIPSTFVLSPTTFDRICPDPSSFHLGSKAAATADADATSEETRERIARAERFFFIELLLFLSCAPKIGVPIPLAGGKCVRFVHYVEADDPRLSDVLENFTTENRLIDLYFIIVI